MDLSPEQQAANNALEQAIHETCRAYEILCDDEIVAGWVVAGCTMGADPTKTSYFCLHPNGMQPNHIAVGLLCCAETELLKTVDDE